MTSLKYHRHVAKTSIASKSPNDHQNITTPFQTHRQHIINTSPTDQPHIVKPSPKYYWDQHAKNPWGVEQSGPTHEEPWPRNLGERGVATNQNQHMRKPDQRTSGNPTGQATSGNPRDNQPAPTHGGRRTNLDRPFCRSKDP